MFCGTISRMGAPKDEPSYAKQVLATYPSLSDMERVVQSNKYSHYGRNMMKCDDNPSKVFRIGWNEPKIHDMLNYDPYKNDEVCRSTAIQPEAQQPTQSICWQIPPKVDIDTVDGIVRHNMASNIENKDTPVKSKLYQSSKLSKASKKQGYMWSEQLRNLSPWPNKSHGQTEYRKSNLRSSSKEFLKLSKKKILRLVSPKKNNKERHNFQIRKTPYRNIGIQTSHEDVGLHQRLQSPPGSYHSPIHSSLPKSLSFSDSRNITANDIEPVGTHFDFSRHIQSPPKKTARSSQRKLNFPLNCASSARDVNVPPAAFKEIKTYRSFNGELDHDVSLSKMSYILNNIRAKLEASDEHAIRTFRETENGDPIHITSSFDVSLPDVQQKIPQNISGRLRIGLGVCNNEPIYSEIEDDSMRISESPNFENRTGIQHFNVEHNPKVLYALVNKSNTINKTCPLANALQKQNPTPLGKLLHDSLETKRNAQKKNFKKTPSLSPLPEPPGDEVISYSSPSSLHGELLNCHSMNNVRVMEHHSPPKRQRNLSKSDLSLHRSEIFLENLCRSELIAESHIGCPKQEKIHKIENNKTKQSYVSLSQPSPNYTLNTGAESGQDVLNEDVVSYELPVDDMYVIKESIYIDSTNAGSNLGLSAIAPPSFNNQSTPKKATFITKDKERQLNVDIVHDDMPQYNGELSNSYKHIPNKSNEILQVKPQHNSRSQSFTEISYYQSNTKTNILPTYKHIKAALHKSFQKSKEFVKKETKRLSTSLNFTGSNSYDVLCHTNVRKENRSRGDSSLGSDLDLDSLLSLKQCTSINEQLEQVVNICRQFPDSEISTEMVEAERLLLFSELRRGKQQTTMPTLTNRSLDQLPITYLFIDDIYLPIRADINLDIFFNYFYIVTFECGGIIRSTQSAECQNGLAVFRHCGIEFSLRSELYEEEIQKAVLCNIFMLRLRKVSTLSLEPTKKKFPEVPGKIRSSSTSSSSSEIVSRFRLYASFTLSCKNFIPYDYVAEESINSDRLCLRATRSCNIMPTYFHKSPNVSGELNLVGRAEVRYPKRKHAGFLNVEDPYTQHNWNRRWCTLDGIHLLVWHDENTLNQLPLLSLNLQANPYTLLRPASPDVCARPRSFYLVCHIRKSDADLIPATVFFAADSQDDLNVWIDNLNLVLYFIQSWLS